LIGDYAPKLVELNDEVLFGDVWERPELSKRDRSLMTISALVALYRIEQLPAHIQRGLDNGLSQNEIIEAITHASRVLCRLALRMVGHSDRQEDFRKDRVILAATCGRNAGAFHRYTNNIAERRLRGWTQSAYWHQTKAHRRAIPRMLYHEHLCPGGLGAMAIFALGVVWG